MAYGDYNPDHQRDFTYSKSVWNDDVETIIEYKDRGWANSGIPYCECDQKHKETHSNGVFSFRGTDEIVICHNCKSFIHIDMSD
jgi:hypothetical protein